MEVLVLNPLEIPVENQDKKTQDKEAQHHTQNIVKLSVQENNYIVNPYSTTP